jgi:hypothetical protein
METPLLQAVDDEFDERNVVLYLALGAVSLSRRLDDVLSTALSYSKDDSRERSRGDETLLFGALGLMAIRAQIIGALSEAAQQEKPSRTRPVPEDNDPSPLGTLLR